MRRVLALLLLVAVVPLLAQPRGRDLWIGALLFEDEETGLSRSDGRVVLQPIASLMDGAWHVTPNDDPELDERLRASAGRVPAVWLPLGQRLPLDWRGWLVDGRPLLVRASGPLRPRPIFDELMIDTDLRLSRSKDTWSGGVAGVAIAGDVTVRPFLALDASTERRLLEALTPALVAEERTRLAAAAPSDPTQFTPTRRQLLRAPREVDAAVVLTREDGTQTAYLATYATVKGSKGECGDRFSAVVAERRSGGPWHQVWRQSWSACDGLFIAHLPMAELERGGRTCWVTAARYEDGMSFGLTAPNTLDDYPAAACDIR
ncbi:MAG: hypothetical protein U0P30_07360 [Vicinamibacterales bacterium]